MCINDTLYFTILVAKFIKHEAVKSSLKKAKTEQYYNFPNKAAVDHEAEVQGEFQIAKMNFISTRGTRRTYVMVRTPALKRIARRRLRKSRITAIVIIAIGMVRAGAVEAAAIISICFSKRVSNQIPFLVLNVVK